MASADREVGRPALPLRRAPGRLTAILLVVMVAALTAAALIGFVRVARERDESRFRNATETVRDALRTRLDAYISILLATQSYFIAEWGELQLDSFRTFVSELQLDERYPGVQGVGFSRRLVPHEIARVVERIEDQYREPFRIWPAEPWRDEYHAIVFLEPQDRRNRAALGYDMFTEPVRREAMERARDTGSPAVSGRVILVQEIDLRQQYGFLIYVPVYRGGGEPSEVAWRREDLLGFVYSPFRADDLVQGIFGTQQAPRVAFDLYDGLVPDEASLLHRGIQHDRDEAEHTAVIGLEVGGRPWTLVVQTTAAFHEASSDRMLPYLLAIGLLVNLGFMLATRAQLRARRQEAEGRQRLMEAVRIRDDFLSIAGHELRTPLAALQLQVQGLLRQAERGGFGPLPDRLLERLRKALTLVGRLEALIAGLLDVSRIAAGKLALHLEEVDLVGMLGDIVDRFADHLSHAGCEVTIRANERVVGEWDRVRIDQVFTNLISNALKYGAGKPIEIEIARDNGAARVAVRDHGIGISAEDTGRVFGRFERAVSDRNYGGLGLGLWISRQIVEALGGKIELVSRLGEGSTFTVELPLAEDRDD